MPPRSLGAEALLGEREGHRRAGTNRRVQHRATRSVYARRRVERKHGRRLRARPADHVGCRSAWCAVEAVSDDSVDHQIVRSVSIRCAGRRRDVHRLDDVELMAWNLREPFPGLAHEHLDVCTPIGKSASAHERTAPIAAYASQDGDTLAIWIRLEESQPRELREISPCVFHHLNQRDPEVLDHRPIDLDHLLGREKRYAALVDPREHEESLRRVGARPIHPVRCKTEGSNVGDGLQLLVVQHFRYGERCLIERGHRVPGFPPDMLARFAQVTRCVWGPESARVHPKRRANATHERPAKGAGTRSVPRRRDGRWNVRRRFRRANLGDAQSVDLIYKKQLYYLSCQRVGRDQVLGKASSEEDGNDSIRRFPTLDCTRRSGLGHAGSARRDVRGGRQP